MGIEANSARFLLYAKSAGVSFDETATIGRHAFFLSRRSLGRVLADFGYPAGRSEVLRLLQERQGFAEPLFGLLGAARVRSFDASAYEGATDLHDFNLPIPDLWKESFTAVVDLGSLEHVFNCVTALKNAMEMVRVGGHFLSIAPVNNYVGHGFYQFNPEFFFRALSSENGFKILRMFLFETRPGAVWYEVVDSATLRRRVTLVNVKQTLLAVLALRTAQAQIFKAFPLQSDYVEAWQGGSSSPSRLRGICASFLAAARKRGWIGRYDPEWFRRVRIP